MPSRELREAVRRLRLGLRNRVSDGMLGQDRSVFRGDGLEFHDVREYSAGDDTRFIDWNVSARRGRWHVKNFEEERDRRLNFVLDLSASTEAMLGCGPARLTWWDALALLGLSAAESGDRVGMALIGAESPCWMPALGGVAQVYRLLDALDAARPAAASWAAGLDEASRRIEGRGVLVIASDFLDPGWLQPMSLLARRHQILAVRVCGKWEGLANQAGVVRVHDPESGRSCEWDLADPQVLQALRDDEQLRSQRFRELCHRRRVETVEIPCGEPAIEPLLRFLERRRLGGWR